MVDDQKKSPMDVDAFLQNFQGAEDLIEMIVEEFIKTYPDLVKQIESALKDREPQLLQISAHTLKGAVSNFKAGPTTDIAFELEKIGRSGELSDESLDDANKLFIQLQSEIEKLIPEIKKLATTAARSA